MPFMVVAPVTVRAVTEVVARVELPLTVSWVMVVVARVDVALTFNPEAVEKVKRLEPAVEEAPEAKSIWLAENRKVCC